MNELRQHNNKKILLVSNAFYPEISPRSYRATELAKEFCRQGHSVVVISKFRDFDYAEFLDKFPILLKMWSKPKFPAIPQFKSKPFSLISRFLSRILLLLFEYPGIEDMLKVKKKLNDENGYDLMISFAVPYPVHWGVAWSRSRKHRIAGTWVADCGDPYMGDVLDSFRKPFYFSFFEKNFCKKADIITIPIESAKPAYYKEFHAKIKIIPQGFEFNLDNSPKELPKSDCINFAYAGSFLPGARDPKKFMECLIRVNQSFKFYVFTNKPETLTEYETALQNKLIISGYIPRHELMKVLTGMNFLVNFDNNTLLNSPSKLIDYAIVKRPVLNVTNNFDEADLYQFMRGDFSRQMVLPDPEMYHISNISKRFLEVL
ncbi:MAG TPA: hypothetical protein VK179_15215 [Bacteroidales bacterium]|nr:hypothetical protein [Bacteroidales bacterium]